MSEFKDLVDEMVLKSVYGTAVEMPIPLYEKIKKALTIAENMQWRTIDSAPEDGTSFLVLCEKPLSKDKKQEILVTAIEEKRYTGLMFFHEPTHWMPLPQPPKGNE